MYHLKIQKLLKNIVLYITLVIAVISLYESSNPIIDEQSI